MEVRSRAAPRESCAHWRFRWWRSAWRQVLDQAVGCKYSRDGAKADPLPRMRGAPCQIEAAEIRAAMGEAAGAHETGGHHGIHAIAKEVKLGAPLGGHAR